MMSATKVAPPNKHAESQKIPMSLRASGASAAIDRVGHCDKHYGAQHIIINILE
ncbi:MAG: hypothetical protein K2N54_00360 [Helicobacter sp.]|nr:hypothetical protein [Helicobacter sp.]